jgi:hypothetical protein
MEPHAISDYWILIPFLVLVLIYRIFKRRIKGFFGERGIALRLAQLNKLRYKVINNLVLDMAGKTSQIDHLIISDFGLFVVETKNFKGWIFGYENSEYWTQVVFKRKEQFYNPIRQNRGHIVALKNCLSEFRNIRYIPIVVFSNSCTLKVETESDVIYSAYLLKGIRSYSEVVLTKNEQLAIYDRITSLNISHRYYRNAHIKSIKQRIRQRQKSIDSNICPHCGGDLTLRNGIFGRFYGCNNFPRCKFTIK